MSEMTSTALRCKHCGGALIDKLDDVACVMCGRVMGHLCENCQFKDEPKPEPVSSSRRKPASAKNRGKARA